jgi:tRNA threonylcarbamoyladenosine biosynthesis protein TsaE
VWLSLTNSIQLSSNNEAATLRIGEQLAEILEPGSVVGLVGTLGAGKTRLVQAICAGLGVDTDQVNSPTFVLIQEYEGRLPVYHFDTYRLRDIDEFLELGADEYLQGDGVCLIEWADRMADVLPQDRLTVEIEIVGENQRAITLLASGNRSRSALMSFAANQC